QSTDGPDLAPRRRPDRPVRPARLKPEPTIALAPEPWDRLRARRLDPTKALRLRGQKPPRATVYVGDSLLVRGLVAGDGELAELRTAASEAGLRIVDDTEVKRDTELLAAAELPEDLRRRL